MGRVTDGVKKEKDMSAHLQILARGTVGSCRLVMPKKIIIKK